MIDEILAWANQDPHGCDCKSCRMRKSVAAEISRLTAELAALESQHRWRSAAEEKPEAHQGVLCNFGDEECHVLAYSQAYGTWYRQLDAKPWSPPTHWREIGPLPALPPAETEPTT